MFQNDKSYFLPFNPPAFKKPLWLARINRDFTEATVYCSEKLVRRKNGMAVLSNPVSYPLDQILMMYMLAQREGALLHAAGIDMHGKGYIFPGKSGAGKSTIARHFAARGFTGLLSDDRIVVRKLDGLFRAYGTPWPGDAGMALNRKVTLCAIFFINHGSVNRIKDLSPREALERLLPITSIPWYDRKIMTKILTFCEDLVLHVPAFNLHFKPGIEVVDAFQQFVSAQPR